MREELPEELQRLADIAKRDMLLVQRNKDELSGWRNLFERLVVAVENYSNAYRSAFTTVANQEQTCACTPEEISALLPHSEPEIEEDYEELKKRVEARGITVPKKTKRSTLLKMLRESELPSGLPEMISPDLAEKLKSSLGVTKEEKAALLTPEDLLGAPPTFEVTRKEALAMAWTYVKKNSAEKAGAIVKKISGADKFDDIPEDKLAAVYDAFKKELGQ